MNRVLTSLKSKKGILILAVVVFAAVISNFSLQQNKVNAAPVTGFGAGRIIDDSIFTNATSMSVDSIQAFLNSKVPSCDTWGAQPSEYGGGTRRQWAEARGHYPPYTCLRDFSENGKSAAQIIYDTAQEFQINPQVFIVLLQKEQGLVTDTWPLSTQYRTATGYGCPDTAPCDSQYYGLTNQIRWSGRMFRSIMNSSPSWYTPYVLGNNFIRWSPNASCGGSNVNIQNRATQALYNYTPYQPNQAALNAGYGTGDGCSAYGNRNFYLYFTDWFGSTKQINLPTCDEATNTAVDCAWLLYNGTTGVTRITNSDSERISLINSGFHISGKVFYGIVERAPRQNNIPVYRLTKPGGGDTFLTTNLAERDALIGGQGFEDKGILFYADPPGSNSGYPVFRLFSSSLGKHKWTKSISERDQLMGAGYSYEGIAFTSISPLAQEIAPPAGKTLVYRFFIPQKTAHFWTENIEERDNLVRQGYRYEGVSWYGSSNTSDLPVYRLFSLGVGKHLYTTNEHEKNDLVNTGAWRYEGISQYVSRTTTSKPVYRLFTPIATSHLLTMNAAERDELVRNGSFRYEGVAWYQPE